MKKPLDIYRHLFCTFCLFFGLNASFAQEDDPSLKYKNQISTNVASLALGTVELNYERTLGNHFAIGLGGIRYSDAFRELELQSLSSFEYAVIYEINLFGRWYFNGTQRKSHFLELFTSVNEIEEFDNFVRETNNEGFGVYRPGELKRTNFGLGSGYGYRFLLLDNKLLLEAQIGLRTNFIEQFLFFDVAVVRTGFKVGYRF